MYGAIIGDIAGSTFEFAPTKKKSFDMFSDACGITDDTVMTTAVAEALLDMDGSETDEEIREAFVRSMRKWGSRYPDAGYGSMFASWLASDDPRPYNSYGNGSAMRVSPVGWFSRDIREAMRLAKLSAEVTHDHPDGIKGAQAAACAVYMARIGATKEQIRTFIENRFGYHLHRTCREIRDDYSFDVTCRGSVPEAIIAFLDGTDYEDVIREAVALGGDADTQAAIAGAIAEAFYCRARNRKQSFGSVEGIPDDIAGRADAYIPDDIKEVMTRFYDRLNEME